jgi:hypothetical protein
VLVGVFCLALLYLLSQTVLRTSIEASEQHAYRRVGRGLRNPRRLRDAPLRISFLTLSMFVGYPLYWLYSTFAVQLALLTYCLLVLTTALLYLLACDPLPPQAVGGLARVSHQAPAHTAVPESSGGRTGLRRSRAA